MSPLSLADDKENSKMAQVQIERLFKSVIFSELIHLGVSHYTLYAFPISQKSTYLEGPKNV